VSAELALMTAIVAVTAVLVSAPPARTDVEEHGVVETVADLGALQAHVMVDPAMAGSNTIRLELMEGETHAQRVSDVRVAATLSSRGIGPLLFTARPEAPGTFVVRGAQLPIAGDWQLRIEVGRGEFELLAQTVSVDVEEES
jgi:copper transport protein